MSSKALWGIVVVIILVVLGFALFGAQPSDEGAEDNVSVEGDSQVSEDTEVAGDIVGVWRSQQDAKFVRVFEADGAFIDRYEGAEDATMTGMWNVVADISEVEGMPADPEVTYIKTEAEGTVLYFGVADLDETSLTLTASNGVLVFDREE